jgi:hypothetical protein
MTQEQISADMEALKFETAKHIRAALDQARCEAEAVGRDPDEFESAILKLVTEEG